MQRGSFLSFIILIEGFITISVEILVIRQLIPMVGNNIVVTSLIIGIFLLALAYGYRRGGYYQVNYEDALKKNFTYATFWLGIGLSYIFISYFFHWLHIVSHIPLLAVLTLYLFIITAPLVYLLGQTVPITISMLRHEQSAGRLSGKVLHLSTIGSFLGAVLTSLLLLNFLGVAWSIFFNCALLVTMTLLLINYHYRQIEILRLTALIIGIIVTYTFNVNFENSVFIKTNNYANYQVVYPFKLNAHDTGKLLSVNNSFSSFINKKKQGFEYIELIKRILFQDLALHNKTILVLGAGGFTLSAAGENGNHFVYVDIDPDLYKIVQQNFLSPILGRFVVGDARSYIRETKQKYDVIISDSYSNRMAIPFYLLTQQHFKNIRQALNPDGLAIFNIIARPTFNDAYSKRIDNTIRSIFPSCVVIPLHYASQPTNIIYVCQKSSYERDNNVYTDDLNTAPLDFFQQEKGRVGNN
ncbi:MAG: fused MFS/spermidine synthase [Gammaproteobacteria bacterium]